MERKLVTCPESAHLEEIEYETSPFGILITACSRFQPCTEVECARACAARLDRRAQRSQADTDTDADRETDLEIDVYVERPDGTPGAT